MTRVPDDCRFDEDREIPDREDLQLGLALPKTYAPDYRVGVYGNDDRERDLARIHEIDQRRARAIDAENRRIRDQIMRRHGLVGDCEIDCQVQCHGLCGATP